MRTMMVDKHGNAVRKGDAVLYWHKVEGKPVPEIGEVVGFTVTSNCKWQQAIIERKEYNGTDKSFRSKSGITLMSKGDAVLWKMEQFQPMEIQ